MIAFSVMILFGHTLSLVPLIAWTCRPRWRHNFFTAKWITGSECFPLDLSNWRYQKSTPNYVEIIPSFTHIIEHNSIIIIIIIFVVNSNRSTNSTVSHLIEFWYSELSYNLKSTKIWLNSRISIFFINNVQFPHMSSTRNSIHKSCCSRKQNFYV